MILQHLKLSSYRLAPCTESKTMPPLGLLKIRGPLKSTSFSCCSTSTICLGSTEATFFMPFLPMYLSHHSPVCLVTCHPPHCNLQAHICPRPTSTPDTSHCAFWKLRSVISKMFSILHLFSEYFLHPVAKGLTLP